MLTNRGKYLLLGYLFRGTTPPTNLYVALCTSASAPTVDTNTLSELTEIAAGNGYTSGGIQITPNATDVDVYTEDDGANTAFVQLKDIVWTATGGNLPASGSGARWVVLTTDEVTVGNRQVIMAEDLGSDVTVSDTQTLTVPDFQLTLAEPA